MRLDVTGAVGLEVDGVPARLVARDGELRLELVRLDWLRRSGALRRAPAVARVLSGLGLTLRVVWHGRTMVSLGASPDRLGWLIGRAGRGR